MNIIRETNKQSITAFCRALLLPIVLLLPASGLSAPAAPQQQGKIQRGKSGGFAPQSPSAANRMNALGSENGQMAQRTGTWDVVETVWASPGAVPTSHKYMAERKMVGPFFQETIQPAPGSAAPDFRRMYYLSFNRVEGRWKYVSLDTRNPVGLMPAASFGPGEKGQITLTFEPFALPGPGANVTGQMLRMDEIMMQKDATHDMAEERFMMADGSGKMWVAYRYDYVRRS